MRQISAKAALRKEVDELAASRATLADYSVSLRERCDRLERERAAIGFHISAHPLDDYQGLFESMINKMGFTAHAINEAHAVIFAELAESDFTGIGLSFGGGMANACIAYKSIPCLSFSVARGGDWIDKNVANVLGCPRSKATHIKERGIDIRDPKSREEEAVGRSVFDLVCPEHRDAFVRMHQDVIGGAARTLQFEVQGLQGTRRWLETHAVPFQNPVTGGTEHLAITYDISERKKSEDALRLSTEATGTVVGAQQLSNVRWSVVFDDVELTADEIARLAAEARPLVRSKGRWVELDKVDLKEAAAALAERADQTRLSGAEILRASVGLEGSLLAGGLRVEGTGWATDLLAKASQPAEITTRPEGFTGELRAYQAQTVMSARVVAAMPVLVLVVIRQVNPRYLAVFNDWSGQVLLALCLVSIVIGYVSMLWLTRIPGERRIFR